EVVDAINSAEGISVSARVDGDHFVLTDSAGGTGGLRVTDVSGYTTAESLGIFRDGSSPAAPTITGSAVYRLSGQTPLASLHDQNGVRVTNVAGTSAHDFTITLASGRTQDVFLGDVLSGGHITTPAASTVQDVIDRINTALGADLTASISADGSGITLVDHTT